jgi:hypothetical protein
MNTSKRQIRFPSSIDSHRLRFECEVNTGRVIVVESPLSPTPANLCRISRGALNVDMLFCRFSHFDHVMSAKHNQAKSQRLPELAYDIYLAS